MTTIIYHTQVHFEKRFIKILFCFEGSCFDHFSLLGSENTLYWFRMITFISEFQKPRIQLKTIQIKPFIILTVLRQSVYRVCGAHLRVIAPRQHSYLCRC